jgi:hypothetical protein
VQLVREVGNIIRRVTCGATQLFATVPALHREPFQFIKSTADSEVHLLLGLLGLAVSGRQVLRHLFLKLSAGIENMVGCGTVWATELRATGPALPQLSL